MELIADDEKGVFLPARSFAWGRGPTSGRWLGRPAPGFLVDVRLNIGPIASVMPRKRNAGAPSTISVFYNVDCRLVCPSDFFVTLGVNIFMVAASGMLPEAAASCSNSSGVR